MYLDKRLIYAPVIATLAHFLPLNFSNKLKLPQKYARNFYHESVLKNIPIYLN